MNRTHPNRILIAILSFYFLVPVYRPAVQAEPDPFPVYSSIQPNVAFWIKIFTQHTSEYAVIHDNQELTRIYTVIQLVKSEHRGSKKINRLRIKKSKERYKSILSNLMLGKAPVGPTEQRVAELFGPDAKAEDYRKGMENIRGQIGLKDRFRAGIIRSGAYINEIKQIFRKADLPEDLAYLPHVESSFNPNAYSKSGAVGTWQFTRPTGKLFLKVGDTIDERRDPMLSSHAAAQFLCQNYLKLKNWPMAITAYNHGANGMLRAKRSHGSYESILENYESRSFGFASRNFYSEFLAAREIAGNYRKYFGDLKLASPGKTREVILTGYVSLPELAQYLKITLADLRKLNPAFRQSIFRGQKYVPKGYPLQLPDRNNENWNAVFSKLPDKFYRQKQRRSRVYIVRRGDTAGKIARRHGVTLSALIAANNLNSRATIYVNQKIKIPLQAEKTMLIAKT